MAGSKDRKTGKGKVRVVAHTDKETLQGFVQESITLMVYTDEALAYRGLPHHKSVKHSAGQYVDQEVHTNGLESFLARLKRAYCGTYHPISRKHSQRYVAQFAFAHNIRYMDTLDRMALVVTRMMGKRLRYARLVAGEGCSM